MYSSFGFPVPFLEHFCCKHWWGSKLSVAAAIVCSTNSLSCVFELSNIDPRTLCHEEHFSLSATPRARTRALSSCHNLLSHKFLRKCVLRRATRRSGGPLLTSNDHEEVIIWHLVPLLDSFVYICVHIVGFGSFKVNAQLPETRLMRVYVYFCLGDRRVNSIPQILLSRKMSIYYVHTYII